MGKLKKIHQKSAGIDIGSEKIFIGLENEEVKSFYTYTSSLTQAINYLLEKQITTVAMEATGVYWVILYEMLEQAGMEVYLVNPRETKNVPGRKSDVSDCQWIQQLHSYGLLRKSFIPQDAIRQLRVYVRLREDHIEMASSHIQHMQKALTMMNIRLHQVISQLNGSSGIRIIEAILAGETDPKILTGLCDRQILKHKKEQVEESLKGYYKEEHLFALRQAYQSWCFYQHQIAECDKEIEKHLEDITKNKRLPEEIKKAKPIRHNKPEIEEFHEKMIKLADGKDASQLPGLTDYSLMKIVAEIGTDMSAWKTCKHFTSWLGLSPGKNSSGKMSKRAKKKPTTKAGQIFKEAAHSILKSKHIALGAFARRIKAKKGSGIAIKATARKLAVMFYNLMTKGTEYVESGVRQYDLLYQKQMTKYILKKAQQFGFQIIPTA